MFKKDNLVWLYFIGIVVMMIIIFFAGRDYIIPYATGRGDLEFETGFVYSRPPSLTINTGLDYKAVVETNLGTFTVDLFEDAAPNNVNNFVFLAENNYYNGTYFHRLVPGLFIQGGDRNSLNDDPADDGFGSPGYIVEDEINWDAYDFSEAKEAQLEAIGHTSDGEVNSIPLRQYSLAMASSLPDTNGSQFFIVLASSDDVRLTEMAGKYTVIGEVSTGRDVLRRLSSTEVDASDAVVPRPVRRLVINDLDTYTE